MLLAEWMSSVKNVGPLNSKEKLKAFAALMEKSRSCHFQDLLKNFSSFGLTEVELHMC